jgi:hypothetical protein
MTGFWLIKDGICQKAAFTKALSGRKNGHRETVGITSPLVPKSSK